MSETLPHPTKDSSEQTDLEQISGNRVVDESIQIFEFADQKLRTDIDDVGNPLFCGLDAARMLGYKRPNDAISSHCRGTVIRRTIIDSIGRAQKVRFISEGDLYRLIAGSKLPEAQKFESWIFDDVVPSIRRHGIYATDITIEKMISDPDFAIRLLTELKESRERQKKLEKENERLSNRYETLRDDVREKVIPYAEIGRAVTKNIYAMSVLQLSHVLQSCGAKDLGRNRLFQRMRDDGLIHIENGENLPYQFARENGWMTTKLVECSDGRWRNQIYITPKGLRHLVQRYAHKTLSKDEVSMYMEKYGEVERQEVQAKRIDE